MHLKDKTTAPIVLSQVYLRRRIPRHSLDLHANAQCDRIYVTINNNYGNNNNKNFKK